MPPDPDPGPFCESVKGFEVNVSFVGVATRRDPALDEGFEIRAQGSVHWSRPSVPQLMVSTSL